MLAKHIGVEVNTKMIDLNALDQMSPEYLEMNPQHTVPTINDNGFTLWESRAIMTYLVRKYAPNSTLIPKDLKKRAVMERMLYFDVATFYKALGEYFYPKLFDGNELEAKNEVKLKFSLELMDQFLAKNKYMAGDQLTLADISLLASMTFPIIMEYDLTGYTNLDNWIHRIQKELPYYDEINQKPIDDFKEYLRQKEAKEANGINGH